MRDTVARPFALTVCWKVCDEVTPSKSIRTESILAEANPDTSMDVCAVMNPNTSVVIPIVLTLVNVVPAGIVLAAAIE